MKGSVIFAILFLIGLPTWADECLTREDIQEVVSEISVQDWNGQHSFDSSWKNIEDFNHCDSSSLSYKILKSIIRLKNLPTLVETIDGFDQGVLKDSPYQFFLERVSILRIDNNPSSTHCEAGVSGTLAYVLDSYSNIMHVCPFVQNFSELQMLGTLIHEARHLLQHESYGQEKKQFKESNGSSNQAHSHVPCEFGFFMNSYSCDKSIDKKGSYAVEMEFFLKLSRTPTLPEDFRQQAKGIAIDGYLGHFNSIPGGQLGMMLITEDNKALFYDPETDQSSLLIEQTNQPTVLTDRFTPTIYNTENGSVLSFAGPNVLVPTNGVFAQSYRNLSEMQRSKLLDIGYGNTHQCLLFTDSIYCSNGSETQTFELSKDLHPTQLTLLRGFSGNDLFFIATEDGKHFRLPTELPLSDWDLSQLEEIPSLENFRSVGLMPKLKRFGIDSDGTFVSYDQPTDREPIESLSSVKFKKIRAPYYWSEQLKDL